MKINEMKPVKAEEIINNYWKSIKDLRPEAIVQSISDLPYSPGMIRYAHFVYAEWLIKENILTRKIGDRLIESYSQISKLFVEEPETINNKYREHLKMLEKGLISDFRFSEALFSVELSVEFNNFLAECQSNEGRN